MSSLPTEVGDPFSDPNYLHLMCEKNFKFDQMQKDRDGLPNDLDSKCYIHCLLGTIGVIDSQEKLHIDVFLPGVDDVTAARLTQQCGRLSK